jgi:hypothetical protein
MVRRTILSSGIISPRPENAHVPPCSHIPLMGRAVGSRICAPVGPGLAAPRPVFEPVVHHWCRHAGLQPADVARTGRRVDNSVAVVKLVDQNVDRGQRVSHFRGQD